MRLFGKNPTFERLRSNPASIRKIYMQQGFKEAGFIYKKAKKFNVPVISVTRSKMTKMGRNINTQGVIMDTDDFEYMDYNEMLDYAFEKKRTLIFLDELNDPQNLGAIIRTAGCLGHFSIVLPTHKSVGVTQAVLRVASGGENHVQISLVSNLNKAIRKAKEEGFTIAGTVVEGGQPIEEVRFTFPVGIVLGSEQKGIREVTKKYIDLELTIPMLMDRLSLNAAHAATILCYEITRQKILRKKK